MKFTSISLFALSASTVCSRFIEKHETNQIVLNSDSEDVELFLIELAPGETRVVTEEEKWELKRVLFLSPVLKAGLIIPRRMARTSWTLLRLRT